jgi:divalent metal cation (Fe/Co/Zn/Cd) transporter
MDPRARAITLEYVTLGWMVIEAGIALFAGALASSIALVGFGLDSVIEIVAAATLLWRLTRDGEREAAAEAQALKVVGMTFFALAAYVAYESVTDLFFRRSPQSSLLGIGLAVAALMIMPFLAVAKRRVAVAMNSRALAAEAMQSFCCAYFAATLLVGLVLNRWMGWWWADPAAALIMVSLMVREGVESFKERPGCCHASHAFPATH